MARTRSIGRAPADEALTRLPAPIQEKLSALVRRVRWIQVRRGCLATLAATAVVVITLMVVNASFTILSPPLNATLSALGLGAIAICAYRTLYRPLRRALSTTQMARIIEHRHPELHERISTSIELLAGDRQATFAGSQQLVSKVVESATADAEEFRPEQEFTNRTARCYLLALGGAALILGAGFLAFPAPATRVLTQVVAPFSKIGNAYAERLQVEPGNLRMADGDPISIQVTVNDADAQRAEIHIASPGVAETVESLTLVRRDAEAGTSEFAITFPAINDGFSYRVRSGRAVSASYDVDVAKRPEIRRLELSYQFPEYTAQPPLVTAGLGQSIEAITGTQIQIRAHFDRPLDSAVLKIDGNPLPATEDQAGEPHNPRATWKFEMVSGTQGKWRIELGDSESISSRLIDSPIRAIPDLPPSIRLIGQQDELRVRPDEHLGIRYEVDEDFGLAAAYLRIAEMQERIPLGLPERNEDGSFSGLASLDLSRIPLAEDTQAIQMFIVVEDTRPDPQSAETVPISITIDPDAGSLAEQSVDRQRNGMRRSLTVAIEKLRMAATLSKQFPGQLVKPDSLPLELLPPLAEARTLIGEAESLVRATVARAATPSSFFRNLAPKLDSAATDHIANARRAAEEISLTDAKITRVHRAHKVVRQLDEGIADLEVALRELKQQAASARTMAQIGHLSEKQQRLAKALGDAAGAAEQEALRKRQATISEAIGRLASEGQQSISDHLQNARHNASELAHLAGSLAQEQASLSTLLDRSADPGLRESTTAALVQSLENEQRQIGSAAAVGGEASAAAASDPSMVKRLGESTSGAESAAEAIGEGRLGDAASLGAEIGKSLGTLAAGVESQPVSEPIERLASWQRNIADQLQALAGGSLEQALSLRQGFVADRAEDLARRTDRFQRQAEALADPSALQQLQGAGAQANAAARSARQATSQLEGGTSGSAFDFARSPDTIPPGHNRHPNGANLPTQAGVDASPQPGDSHGGSNTPLENPFSVGEANLDELPPTMDGAGGSAGGGVRPPEEPGLAAESPELIGQGNPATGQTSVASAAQQPAMQAQRDLADANSALSNAAGSFAQQANGLAGQGQMEISRQMIEVARQATLLALEENPEALARLAAGISKSLAPQNVVEMPTRPLDDWQNIRGSVKSGVASAKRGAAPEAYRDLVKSYFKEIARLSNDPSNPKR